MQNAIDQLVSWSKELTVLYVEDDLALREEVSLFLSDIFKQIDLAPNGEVGLDKLANNHYDLVITDIRMPVMDGIEMIEKIKASYPKQPILVTSAHNESEYLIKLINLGIKYYITKPLQSDQILKVLYTIVERIHQEKALVQYKHDLEIANEKLKQFTHRQAASLDKQSALLTAYKEALDKATMVALTDKNGIITDANENFCKTTGYDKEELVGQTHRLISHPSTSKSLYKELWQTILSKKTWQGLIINQTKDLKMLYHYTTIVPIIGSDGEISEFISICQDLTELHTRSEKQSSENLSLALSLKEASLLQQIPFPCAFMSNDMIFHMYNKLFEKLVNNHMDESLLLKLTNETLKLKEVIEFEEMEYFSTVEAIKSNWPFDGDVTFKGVVKSIEHILEVLVKINYVDPHTYMICIVNQEEFELCCQVHER
jgi:PAS domain S-box-containing protein